MSSMMDMAAFVLRKDFVLKAASADDGVKDLSADQPRVQTNSSAIVQPVLSLYAMMEKGQFSWRAKIKT